MSSPPSETAQGDTGIHQPDIEDMATELLQQAPHLYNPYVEIDSENGIHVRQYKSTICHILSEPHAALESTDCLKHVQGYSHYQKIIKDIPLGDMDENRTNVIL